MWDFEFIKRTDPVKFRPINNNRNLFNLHLDLIEDKKKLKKILPPVPEWHKTLPPKNKVVEKQKSEQKQVKKESTKSSQGNQSLKQPINKKPDVKKNKAPEVKKPPPKEDSEGEGESEAEDDEELDEDDEGELEDSEGDEDSEGEEESEGDGESEDEDEEGEDGDDAEKEFMYDAPKGGEAKAEQEMTDKEKLANGYTENLTEEEKLEREKKSYLRKWKMLSYRLKKASSKKPEDKELAAKVAALPLLNDHDDLSVIKKHYEDEVFELKIIANTRRYSQMLMMGFGATEMIFSSFGSDLLDGYAKYQFSVMDEYDEILLELGENNENSFLSNMGPEGKLLWAIVVSSGSFIMAKKMGGNASDITALFTGQRITSEPVGPSPKAHLD